MLTDMRCRTAKPRERLYRLNDRDGLYLEVKPNGVKAFRYRFKLGGKESMMGLGEYPVTPLSRRVRKPRLHASSSRTVSTLSSKSSLTRCARSWIAATPWS